VTVHYNPIVGEKRDDPFQLAARDRDEHPVVYVAEGDYFQVTSYEGVRSIAANPKAFSSALGGVTAQTSRASRILPMIDPPEHKLRRSIFAEAFKRRGILSYGPVMQQLAHELLEGLPESGAFDLIGNVASHLPVLMIARILGVPGENLDDFRRWSVASEMAASGIDVEKNAVLTAQFHSYLADQLRERRRSANPPNDLLTHMIEAEWEGETFTDEDIVDMAAFLIIAGNSTTTDGLGNTVMALERNPAQKALFLSDIPKYLSAVIEEGLRFDAPVHALFRTATQDVVVEGATIPKGARVLLLWGAGNRDGKIYERPDEFDFARPRPAPHLTFGWGIHLCLGAQLARLELRVALATLYTRLPGLELESGFQPRQKPGFILRGWSSAPMRFEGPIAPRSVTPVVHDVI